jgi:hypothetical protein
VELNRNFHQQNKFQVAAKLRDAAQAYRAADNQPADLDARPDRVSLQGEGESVQAILTQDGFAERRVTDDGAVTLSSYDVPQWYDPISLASGVEIQKQGETVEGQTLEYTVGWTSSFHHHDEMKAADAQSRSAELEAQFSA